SHDRTFLDNLSKRTYEIGSGNLTVYQGNYSYYIRERKSRMELLENRYNNQQKYIEQQEKFINRFRYKATKARAVQSRIKLLDKIDRVEIEKDAASVNFRFPPAVHSGKILLEIEGLYKSYNRADFVLSNISLIVERGDKIAIVGKNGSGKTTLTRIIAGMESISSGSVKFGYNVKIKYYAQNQAEEMNPEKTALEIMEQAEGRDSAVNLRSILGGFLFHGDDAYKKTGILSGGEKSRLALAKMLIEPSNFLILDEPTNHLDIASKDILTSALSDYEGCVMVVSHDRDFIDSFVTKIIEVRDGGIKVYGGNSYEYQKKKEKELADLDVTDKTNDPEEEKVIKNNYSSGIELKKKKKEFTRASASIKKEISQYEEKIKLLESRKKEIEEYMSSDKFYLDVKNAIAFTNEYKEILSKIEKYSVLWEEKVQKFVTFKKNSIN
ncbi:MAG: ATP-binding cassette domain-containing protein, partial [Ignavibacteriae bacterium]|nr:ATP-binding cassette domain-containing protein [Ignavibacteriota bacterium]